MIDLLKQLFDFVLHVNVHLQTFVDSHGAWTYALLFVIIFAETGLVVTPFLPGDSLLFVAGWLCTISNAINVNVMALILCVAAILGNMTNYAIGSFIGPKVFKRDDSFLLRKKHLERAHEFFQKYGGTAIIISRFVPIIRTFVPFVAGAGKMEWKRFSTYNTIGGISWVCLFLYLGYFCGGFEVVKNHFEIVVPVIILISLIPIIVTFIRARIDAKNSAPAEPPAAE